MLPLRESTTITCGGIGAGTFFTMPLCWLGMINRNTIRKCLVEVIDSFKREEDFAIYEHRDEILSQFDRKAEFSIDDIDIFVNELMERFPESAWSMFRTTFDLYMGDVVAKLPRQTLPLVELSLAKDGRPLKLGLTRIGGVPEWIQPPYPTEENPLCSDCNEIMAFVCQVDSLGAINKTSNVDKYRFVDAGCFFLFACVKCGETSSTFQCH